RRPGGGARRPRGDRPRPARALPAPPRRPRRPAGPGRPDRRGRPGLRPGHRAERQPRRGPLPRHPPRRPPLIPGDHRPWCDGRHGCTLAARARCPPGRRRGVPMTGRARRLRLALVAAVLASAAVTTAAAAPSGAAPPPGEAWVVSLGDSAISGEGGRWAGNTNQSSSKVDAGGADAYWDNARRTAEQIPGCHRSESAAIHIGTARSLNLACSGARTTTHGGGSSDFKPGIDFYDGPYGKGQALADTRPAGFVTGVTPPRWWPTHCHGDGGTKSRFTAANVAAKTAAIRDAILRVRQAMANAGYADSDYTIMVHTYWSPVPPGSGNRYPESGYTRQTVGGCGMWNRDADWANSTVVPTFNSSIRNAVAQAGLSNTKILDLTRSLEGRRLCERTVGLLEERGVASWTSPGAVDQTEWVAQ